jgi:cell wall-associated NlpC family hydrolase
MLVRVFIGIFFSLVFSICHADQETLSLFPLNNYDQTIETWLKPTSPNDDKPLIDTDFQQKRQAEFYNHYFGNASPWSAEYLNKILHAPAPDDLKSIELDILQHFNNQDKPADQIGYGENFHPYYKAWIDTLTDNIDIAQFSNMIYQPRHRGIAIDNLHARVLPTDDVHFYSYKSAGQGYPFDNLQMSALWVGTPVYILTETHDRAWLLVVTPEYIGWVKSNGIAHVDNQFIMEWKSKAKQNLAAITKTKSSIVDEKGTFRFSAYVGSVFPMSENYLLIPVMNTAGYAEIHHARILLDEAVKMPQTATPHHFRELLTTLIGRPYGWGNMYFYNDCSAELKSLLTPFGIWLPRNSADQVHAGKIVDMTAAPAEQRLDYLVKNGHKLLTLVYIGGHIVMYVGQYPNPSSKEHEPMALTYQNIWGLSPIPATRRAVIGGAVLFPMLLKYQEDASLNSLANKKYFQLSYLDELPTNLLAPGTINLRSLMMYPGS